MNLDPTVVPLFVAGMVFLAMALLFSGIFLRYRQGAERRRLVDKLRQGEDLWEVSADEESLLPGSEIGGRGVSGFFSAIGRRLGPKKPDDISLVRKNFIVAGLRGENLPAVFWGVKLVLALVPALLLLFSGFFFTGPLNVNLNLAIVVFVALLGFYLPDIWLRRRIEKRKENLFKGFPDALDLLVVCVEAGMGLDAAIHRVGEEIALSNKPLSDEFNLLSLELRAGKARRDALKNLAMRTDLEEVYNLVSLLIQTDRFGTSLGDALRVYSETFRDKRFNRAEEKATTLPAKLMFPLILFIFPSLLVVILGPAAIRFYRIFFKVM